jgi:hypothetical protein
VLARPAFLFWPGYGLQEEVGWQSTSAPISQRCTRSESALNGGSGKVVVSLKFHQGAPRDMKVLERKPQYRLGGWHQLCRRATAAWAPGITV